MNAASRVAPRGMAQTLTLRLVVTTMVVMVLQAGIVSVRDYFNETDFLNSFVRREAQQIAREVLAQPAGSRGPAHYHGERAASYAFRVVDADGRVMAEQNARLLESLSPWTERPPARQDFWVRKLNPAERMHVAGGLKVRRDGKVYWVELATLGDPDSAYLRSIALDIFDDVWVPMLPLVLLSLIVTYISVRRSLRPLVEAASRADAISTLERGERLDVQRLPQEVSLFASAINRLLDRVTDLVATQRLFIARAAHELRTPLSIMMLELGHLKDPSGKRLETDVRAMSGIVDQLLLLARLEAQPRAGMGLVDVSTVVRELVSRMLTWVEKDGHKLDFITHRETPITADESAVREAVRNLIENAVKHTPPGTKIHVAVLADGSILVEDDGPGLGSSPPEELQMPFRKGSTTTDGAGLGLAIVRQAAELHGGRLKVDQSPLGGARFIVELPGQDSAARPAA